MQLAGFVFAGHADDAASCARSFLPAPTLQGVAQRLVALGVGECSRHGAVVVVRGGFWASPVGGDRYFRVCVGGMQRRELAGVTRQSDWGFAIYRCWLGVGVRGTMSVHEGEPHRDFGYAVTFGDWVACTE